MIIQSPLKKINHLQKSLFRCRTYHGILGHIRDERHFWNSIPWHEEKRDCNISRQSACIHLVIRAVDISKSRAGVQPFRIHSLLQSGSAFVLLFHYYYYYYYYYCCCRYERLLLQVFCSWYFSCLKTPTNNLPPPVSSYSSCVSTGHQDLL